jgi:hypothetical protein
MPKAKVMFMALIRSEISKYKDIVMAMDREMHSRGQKEIVWDSFVHEDEKKSPHSVVIGKVCDELKGMGFMQSFTYDKAHLQNAMYPEDSGVPHAHGMTPEELLKLPQMLNSPIAILTEREGKTRHIDGEDWRCLHFICAIKDEEGQKYYRAIVQPQSHHNGLIISGYASKVISFHKMEDIRFEAMMNGVARGDRQMLYFSNERYLAIDSNTKPIEFYNYASGSLPIKGHYTQDLTLKKIALDHQFAVNKAVSAEMNKLILGKNTRGEAFPLFSSSIKALAHGNSLDKIRSAYNTIQKLSILTTDRALRLRTQEMADKSFARSYTRLMTPELQQEYITKAANKIQTIPVNTKLDLDGVCDLIEKFSASIPTLQNMGINFSDTVANVPVIINARTVAGRFKEAFEKEMIDVLKDKNQEWHQSVSGLYDESYVISIGNL